MKIIKNIINYFKTLKRGKRVLNNLNKMIKSHENQLFIAHRYQLTNEIEREREILTLLKELKK